jgi:hypothetical protein
MAEVNNKTSLAVGPMRTHEGIFIAGVISRPARYSASNFKNGAKMVALRVDTKPDEAIP